MEKILWMPSDDELAQALIDASNEGAHDNIKPVIKQITWFVMNAKSEMKKIIRFDAEKGVMLNLTLQTGDEALKGFIDSQNLLVKWLAKAVLFAVWASSFSAFIKLMKDKKEDYQEVTTATSSKILVLFLHKIGEKYVVWTKDEEVMPMFSRLFDEV